MRCASTVGSTAEGEFPERAALAGLSGFVIKTHASLLMLL